MFKRRSLMLLCFIVVLFLPSNKATTQEDTEWALRFYAHDSREVVTVTPDGIIESMLLPDSMPEPDWDPTLDSMRLSADGGYFAYLTNDELFIYDFINENEVAYPSIDFVEGRIRFESGDFSPNSQQFVVGFVVHNSIQGRGEVRIAQDRGGLMTFEIGNSDAPSAWVISAIDDWFPLQTRWEEPNKIIFYGVGNAYEFGPRWYERVWIPGQTETLTTTDINGLGQTQVLPNREVAVSRNDFSYPHSGDQGMFGYFPNVIVYYDDQGDFKDNQDPTVIYWSEQDQKIRDFNWIANGRGLLIQTNPHTLLTRDGNLQTVAQSGETDVFGTPDGWVVQDSDSLIHYVLQSDNTIEFAEIATISGELTLLRSTPFDDIEGGTFTGIAPYDWGSNLCDNGIPSTVRSGMDALMIRDEDAALFSTYEEGKIGIASLSYYSQVTILDGPECVDGVPWWKVNTYTNNGEFIGWMPEFTDSGERLLEQRGPAYGDTIDIILEREADGYYPTGRPDYACEGFFLPVRLNIGDTAYVAEGAPNNVRSAPSSDAELTGQIPGGAAFEIIGGPACQNEIVWWEVEYEGITGWTGEGRGNNYWVQFEPPGQETATNRDVTQFVRCPGFLPSRLVEGQTGRVTPGTANNVYRVPLVSAELVGQIPGGESFMVLTGPQCRDDMAWWWVDYNGLTGWTAEGQGDTYWLEPLESTSATEAAEIPQCPGFLPSRLTVGQTGRVTPGAANNVRAEPLSSAELVGQIPGGESFTVLAGPTCQDNTAWWQVDYEGLIGWTQEGQGDTYWLEP